MVDPTPQERLQPALLDRLTDDRPSERRESERERVIDIERLREFVIRDLSYLLNSGWMPELQDRDDLGEVRKSVLNYGIDNLEGRAASSMRVKELEAMLVESIKTFEPRILSDTLRVRAVHSMREMTRNAVSFEIHGQLWAHPVPLAMFLKTELDLESGHVAVEEGGD